MLGVHVIDERYTPRNYWGEALGAFGGNLAQGLGGGISRGLEALTQQKVQEISRQKQEQSNLRVLKGLGYNDEQAKQLAPLGSDVIGRLAIEKTKGFARQNVNAPGIGVLMPDLAPSERESVAQLSPGLQLEYYRQYLQSAGYSPQQATQAVEAAAQQTQAAQGVQQAQIPEMSQLSTPTSTLQAAATPSASAVTPGASPQTAAERIRQAQVAKRQEKLQMAQTKLQKAEQARIDRDTKKAAEEIFNAESAAKESDTILSRMMALEKEGGLPYSAVYGTLKKIEEKVSPASGAAAGAAIGAGLGAAGGPLGGAAGAAGGAGVGAAIGGLVSPLTTLLRYGQKWTSPNTEAHEKLTQQYLKNLKSIYGSANISDADVENYMKSIPTLAQSKQGRRQIMHNMAVDNTAAAYKAKVAREIIEKNGGNRPANFQALVQEASDPGLKQILNNRQTNLGFYDLAAGDEKLPSARKYAIGATISKGKKSFVNVMGPGGPVWQPLFKKAD